MTATIVLLLKKKIKVKSKNNAALSNLGLISLTFFEQFLFCLNADFTFTLTSLQNNRDELKCVDVYELGSFHVSWRICI